MNAVNGEVYSIPHYVIKDCQWLIMINLFGIFKLFLDKINISMLICTFIKDGWLVYGV
jgi:hypothetical protein